VAAPVLASYLVEALRRRPTSPSQISLDPGISISYADLGGTRVRYLKAGRGPNLVLFHTLRTQIEIFQRIIHHCAGARGAP
jgi:hypothetical protein